MSQLSRCAARARPFGARGGTLAASFSGGSSLVYGRSAAYRRSLTGFAGNRVSFLSQWRQIARVKTSHPRSLISCPTQVQPKDLLSPTITLHARYFSNGSSIRQENTREDVKRHPEADGTAAASEGETASADQQAKAENDGAESSEKNAESESSEQQGKGGAEGEGQNGKQEAKDPPPPPPHGSKTPWQVFTDTLKTEFKASKEWNESTKALSSGYSEFTQNESIQKAKQAYSQASDAASTTTSAAFKSTGRVIGQSAAWTWDTSVVKGVRKGVNAAGRGIEKATRPVRETEAFKNVKEVIDDGSSSRYGGWVEKEERRKKREKREMNEMMKSGGRRMPENMEEDPNAGTNVTVHKDAAWKESWRDFRDSSRLMQSLFTLKSTYQESENPLISTARSISDRVAGFFAENETAMVIKKFREMDPNFQLEPLLQEMREYILPEVLDAYVKGDVETLKLWLSAAQYQVYAALMQQYTTAGLKSDGRILDIRNVDILSARLLDPGEIPVFILTCRTQEVHVYRNAKTNELAAGMEDKVQQVTYAIGVTRIPEDVSNPETRGWRLIELQKSGRDYI